MTIVPKACIIILSAVSQAGDFTLGYHSPGRVAQLQISTKAAGAPGTDSGDRERSFWG